MNLGEKLVYQALEAEALYGDEALDLEMPPRTDLHRLILMRDQIATLARACRAATSAVDDHMIDYLGDGGKARLGNTFLSVSPKTNYKLREDARSRFWHWVNTHSLAQRLFNPNEARKTGLTEMASTPDPETGEIMDWPTFRATFFDDVAEGDLSLTILDVDGKYTPKWVGRLDDGYIDRPNRRDE